jgi:60 kDa SS-A/Ro ribonucleoprotein
VDDWTRLDRFLMLGTEGGTYYIGEQQLTRECAQSVGAAIKADGARAVNRIVEVSDKGLAARNDPALFALAMAAGADEPSTRELALAALPRVARIGTHLFHFAQYLEAFRGWGRGARRGIANWYLNMPLDRLALQLVKYKQRDGWSHRDLLRLSHPKTEDAERNKLFNYAVKGYPGIGPDEDGEFHPYHHLIEAEYAVHKHHSSGVPQLIRDHKLPRECLPTEALDRVDVWAALLEDMPMTAMIRNLGKMTQIGLLTPMSAAERTVVDALTSTDRLRKARIHPFSVLLALKTYGQGCGFRGKLSWNPTRAVLDALDDAFYHSFQFVQPTGKRIMLALDISGSMCVELMNTNVTAREASSAMAMATAAAESQYMILGFSTYKDGPSISSRWGTRYAPGLMELNISPRQRLDDICRRTEQLPFGGTDCALPMLHAMWHNMDLDAFVIYTDSETWAGDIHPVQALRQYRERFNPRAKLVVVGMTSNGFTIADPTDGGTLDVVGFDASAPAVISNFIKEDAS